MVQLAKMQQRIYDYIAQTIRTQGYPPSCLLYTSDAADD